MDTTLNRRAFAQLFGAGAAALALPVGASARMFETSLMPAVDAVVRLSANENAYGPAPAAIAAMRDAFPLACRYPDEANDVLVEAFAAANHVSADRILLGCGSGEILKMAASSFTGPGRKLVTADPTFEALGAYSRAAGAEVVKVPLTATWGHDLARMMTAAGEKGLVYVCNPNNPTATITPKGEISELLSRAPAGVTILVDEAYHHYAGSPDYQTFIPAVADHRI